MHVQIVFRVARNVARHENNHGTSDERANKEEPEPRSVDLLLEGGLGIGAEGGVDKDCDNAKNFDGADKGGENATRVSQLSQLIDKNAGNLQKVGRVKQRNLGKRNPGY